MRIVVFCNIACPEKTHVVGKWKIFGKWITQPIPAKYGAFNALSHVGFAKHWWSRYFRLTRMYHRARSKKILWKYLKVLVLECTLSSGHYFFILFMILWIVTDVSLFDFAMPLSLGAAQASIQYTIDMSVVFTQWFNTSTRLGPPFQICTQGCAMINAAHW